MKIITTTGSFTGYNEFNDSNDGLEKAKIYLAKQIARNGSKNWSIVRCDRTTSETLFSSAMANDRKLMDQLVTIESRKQIESAVRNLC
jgi:hypothetical protein